VQADVLGRFADGAWGRLQQRLDAAVATGEVRADVRSSTVLEIIAGSTFIATVLRPGEQIDPEWVEVVVDLIVQGIAS
jgi:hypothetical protein